MPYFKGAPAQTVVKMVDRGEEYAASLAAKVQALKVDLAKAEEDAGKRLSELASDIATAGEELSTASSRVEELKRRIVYLNKAESSEREALKRIKADVDFASGSLKALEDVISKRGYEASELSGRISALRVELGHIESSVGCEDRKLKKIFGEITDARGLAEAETVRQEATAKAWQTDIEALRAVKVDLEEEISILEAHKQEAFSVIESSLKREEAVSEREEALVVSTEENANRARELADWKQSLNIEVEAINGRKADLIRRENLLKEARRV